MFAIGLAGSVFFDLDFNSARWRVALYLVLTIAPFAVAAPAIGPMIDRIKGGRRWIIVGSMVLRAILCFLVIRHMSSLLFYPEAFMMLVLGKVYSISKSAVVPSMIPSDEALVEANSKLTVISALAVVVAAGPAGLLLKLGGPGWALGLAMLVFIGATVLSFKIPPVSVAVEPVDEAERSELRSAGIRLASSSMGVARGIVGFLAFMLAFDFKNTGAPLWHLGVVAATAQIGFFLGALVAPQVRRVASEEQIIIANLATMLVGGLITAAIGGMAGAALMSALVGMTSSAARQAFDAIVQRDAPDANRGRTFAKFEMRFQLMWVIGALLPIIIPIPSEVGFLVIAGAAAATGISYSIGMWRIRQGKVPPRRSKLRIRTLVSGRSGSDGDGATSRVPQPPPPTPPPPSNDPDPTVVTSVHAQAGAPVGPLVPTPAPTMPATTPTQAHPRPPVPEWSPPPGWVRSPLDQPDDAQAGRDADDTVRTADGGTTAADAADAAVEAMPGVGTGGDEVAADDTDTSEDGTDYPEPRWRDD